MRMMISLSFSLLLLSFAFFENLETEVLVSKDSKPFAQIAAAAPAKKRAKRAQRSSPPPPIPEREIIQQAPLPIPSGEPYFRYEWKASEDLTGEVFLPTPAPVPVVIFDGEKIKTASGNAVVRLTKVYNILLVDEEEPWTEDSAALFLDQLDRLPKSPFESFREEYDPRPWKVILTKTLLTDDVEVKNRIVRIYQGAFTRAHPTLQPGELGSTDRVFYSNRLFKAILRGFYNNRNHLVEIFRSRFGVSAGYPFPEPIDEYQEFSVEELIFMASVFEDLPHGFHNIPGFDRIVRRKIGLTNPDYPNAAGIAYINEGYMEFTDLGFVKTPAFYIERLVAHELTHFFWAIVLSKETRKEFMAISGWTKEPGKKTKLASETLAKDHPKSVFSKRPEELWYRKTSTDFVSDYAAAHNPAEDFAETMSFYIYQPDKLRTVAPKKI